MLEMLLGIIGALCVGLIIALFDAYKDIKRLQGEVDPLKAKVAELVEKLQQEEKSSRGALHGLRENHERNIEWKEKKIEELRLSHDEWKSLATYCVKALQRFKPGWIWDRLDGKPEYELVFTETPKRPEPRPRSSQGAVNPPPSDKP